MRHLNEYFKKIGAKYLNNDDSEIGSRRFATVFPGWAREWGGGGDVLTIYGYYVCSSVVDHM